MRRPVLLFVCYLTIPWAVLAGNASAQVAPTQRSVDESSLVDEGSIGVEPNSPQEGVEGVDRPLPVPKWKGKKFLFLPIPDGLGKYGYQSWQGGSGEFGHPTAEEVGGKVGTVTQAVVEGSGFNVTLKIESTGRQDTGRGISYGKIFTVEGICLVDDILTARERYVGKTSYTKAWQFSTYDASTGTRSSFRLKRFSPVKIVKAVAGESKDAPVRLIVETEGGKQGFTDIVVSGTNGGMGLKFSRFENSFTPVDPREEHKWPTKVWTAIENSEVFVGMTKEQVLLSLEEPHNVTQVQVGKRTEEIWHYQKWFWNGSVSFRKGKVRSFVQN